MSIFAITLVATCNAKSFKEEKSEDFEENLESFDNLLESLSELGDLYGVSKQMENQVNTIHAPPTYNGENPEEEDEARVEDDFEGFEFEESEPHDSFAERQGVGGDDNLFILPANEEDTLQDIYKRERLPRISQILSSGDADSINKLIEETNEDPFTILPQELKYHELLGADLFFAFITRLMLYFVFVSLALPAMIPVLELFLVLVEEAILWWLGDVPDV